MTRDNFLRILTYHRIANPGESPWLNPRLISATPEGFEEQMQYLHAHYSVVSAAQVLDAVNGVNSLPARAVLITFDDGYVDFAMNAWPILKRHRLPVTLFVPTTFAYRPGASFWWDRLYAALSSTRSRSIVLGKTTFWLRSGEERWSALRKIHKYMQTIPHADAMRILDEMCDRLGNPPAAGRSVLDWDELRQLVSEGVTIGSHSRSHPLLTQVPAATAYDEISGSQEDLKTELGCALPIFCYPNGSFDETVTGILLRCGFSLAFTTKPGHNDLRRPDALHLRRTDITQRTTSAVFRLRLMPVFAYIDQWRKTA